MFADRGKGGGKVARGGAGITVRGVVWSYGSQPFQIPGDRRVCYRFVVRVPSYKAGAGGRRAKARVWVHWVSLPQGVEPPEPGDRGEWSGLLNAARVEAMDTARGLVERGDLIVWCEGDSGRITGRKGASKWKPLQVDGR